MNSLIFAAALLTSLSAMFCVERGLQRRVEAHNRQLALELRKAEVQRDTLADVLAAARERLQQRHTELQVLSKGSAADMASFAPSPFDPEHEGLWPPNKSYCYFSKRLLPTAFFQKFQGSARGMKLRPDTAVVLGLTPEQAVLLDEGFEDLVMEFKSLESERLAPSSAHASDKWPKGTKISYRLPPLMQEMQPFVEQFFVVARTHLEPSQADLFEQWAKVCIADSLGDFAPKARILTFTDEPVRGGHTLTRFEVAEEGGKQLWYYELWTPPIQDVPSGFPEDHRPRFPYRHLFGDNGEKRPKF